MTLATKPLQLETEDDLALADRLRAAREGIIAELRSRIVGQDDVIEQALVALFAGGNCLIIGVPGLAKTLLVHTLAQVLDLSFSRIQFTPDLLPGDVTGVSVFHQDESSFVFHPGPVFANVVLADEINRASPRTQSALLEVMEERQVTVDGHAYRVPRPFLVIATQNPIEMDGTYPLPEAQLDRFLVKTNVGYPDHEAEVRVLTAEHSGAGVGDVPRVSSPEEIDRLIKMARSVHVAPSVLHYIVSLVSHTRQLAQLRLGASPRGALGLLRTSRVRAALHGRNYVVPSDVQALAEPVLGHRVLISPSYESSGGTAEDAIREVVETVQTPPGEDRL